MLPESHLEVPLPRAAPEAGPSLTALVLDDNDIDRMRLRKLCQKAGMLLEVTEAADLDEFRAALDEAPFDLVFIDYCLGPDTGLDALGELGAHPDQTGAVPIMVTSIDRYDVAVTAMRRGCADYIAKDDLNVDLLRMSVTRAFERRAMLAALSESRVLRRTLKGTITRFSRSCGPEMRMVLSGILKQSRGLRQQDDLDADMRSRLTVLERSCTDVVTFLDDLATMIERIGDEADPEGPSRRLS
ncbi:response regulator [Histidinibacterium aquaticum]|uniref:Response regulator n=1 Tax=Histidinibacterium aquaticum TaxID=2613962 RepID=A0A5J5GSX1_9RHOB|nr:response regulator [Histidinibacterium aquaticum]KAA9010472.1 response regulator [Histidinibacterium aquaticum]